MKTLPNSLRLTLFGTALLGLGACSPSNKSSSGDNATPSVNMSAAKPNVPASTATAKLVFKPYLPRPYPFSTDIVSGEKLGADAVTFVQGDYVVKVASKADQDAFSKDPDTYIAKIKLAYDTAKPNPLSTCVVCGMDIDAGDIPFVYEGRQIQVCDKDCLADFQKEPEKYAKMWDDAAKSAAAAKP